MRLSVYCTVTVNCKVCRQPLTGEEADERRIIVRLVGSINYGACVKCGQAVVAYTKGYMKRTNKYIAKQRAKRLAQSPRPARIFADVG